MTLVRPLSEADYADCHALYEAFVGTPDVAGKSQFIKVLGQNSTTMFGAEVAGRVRAMATLHLMENMSYGGRPYALIENVVTHPDFRGQGLGRAVLTHIEEVVKAANGYKIMLLTGREYGAQGFYESLGYNAEEKVGIIKRWNAVPHSR